MRITRHHSWAAVTLIITASLSSLWTSAASASTVAGATPILGVGGTKTIIAVIVVLLIAAAGGVYWFTQRKP